MATVDRTGVTPTDLTGYLDRIESILRSALGGDLNLAAETPQGQLAGLLSLALAEVDEALVHVAAGMSLNTAAGRQLDDYGTLLRLARIPGERSTVTATLSGVPQTIVPLGARARTVQGSIFRTIAHVIILPSGTVGVPMEAVDFGPVIAPAGDLNSPVDAIAGWTGITNAADAVLGRDAETDAQYRRRYGREVAVHARGPLEAIEARILEVSGVTDAAVHDNATASQVTRQSVQIAARSILPIVEGGADADVARAIRDAKPPGIPTVGAETETVDGRAIRFTRVAPIRALVNITTTLGDNFPADGVLQLRQRVADWTAGLWASGPGDFETSGIGIGEALDPIRLYSPISSVPGHTVQSVAITNAVGGATISGAPDLNERITIAAADVTITPT